MCDFALLYIYLPMISKIQVSNKYCIFFYHHHSQCTSTAEYNRSFKSIFIVDYIVA